MMYNMDSWETPVREFTKYCIITFYYMTSAIKKEFVISYEHGIKIVHTQFTQQYDVINTPKTLLTLQYSPTSEQLIKFTKPVIAVFVDLLRLKTDWSSLGKSLLKKTNNSIFRKKILKPSEEWISLLITDVIYIALFMQWDNRGEF